jgi:hypothetical protein
MTDTVSRLLSKLGDNFIGLWRFRVYGSRRRWCVTFQVEGHYYDTYGKVTPEAALADALRTRDRVARDRAAAIESARRKSGRIR